MIIQIRHHRLPRAVPARAGHPRPASRLSGARSEALAAIREQAEREAAKGERLRRLQALARKISEMRAPMQRAADAFRAFTDACTRASDIARDALIRIRIVADDAITGGWR